MLLLQQRFGINVGVTIMDIYPTGPHMVANTVVGIQYADFLERTLAVLLKDVPLSVHKSIWFQHNNTSTKF
jgi:hypothetical protein